MDETTMAVDVWDLKRKPVDIQGRLMMRLDFKLKGWEIVVHHGMFPTVEAADAECRRIQDDLALMTDSKFRAKYRIAHDLRGAF